MAAIGVSLWKYIMRYAPHTPDFFNRDRFVLSNGKSNNLGQGIGMDTNQVFPKAILAYSNTLSCT